MNSPLRRKIELPRFARRFRYNRRRLRRISKTATLGGIFLSFLTIGLTGFGGGLAVISQIRSLAVRERRWFTEREFAEAFALAQSLPGTNAAAYIGLRLRGRRGACVALAGFILPSMLMMIGLANSLQAFAFDSRYGQTFSRIKRGGRRFYHRHGVAYRSRRDWQTLAVVDGNHRVRGCRNFSRDDD